MNDRPQRLDDEGLSVWIRRHPEVWDQRYDSAAADERNDQLIERIMAGDRGTQHRRPASRKRRIVIASTSAVIVVSSAAVGVAALLRSEQPTVPEAGPTCHASVDAAADLIGLEPGVDPITGCRQAWIDGRFGVEVSNPSSLVACIGQGGGIDVFPGESTVCESLGLPVADPELSLDNAAIVVLQDRIATEINAAACLPANRVKPLVEQILSETEITGWQVIIRSDAQASTCVKAAVDSTSKTVHLNKFP